MVIGRHRSTADAQRRAPAKVRWHVHCPVRPRAADSAFLS
jgi:hypothetical protein